MNSFLSTTSDKSSIIVLSDSMDMPETMACSESPSQHKEPNSISTIESTSSVSSNNTRIQCVSESMATNSEKASAGQSGVENDGISVINTIQSRPSSTGELNDDQVQVLKNRLSEYKSENSELKEQYNFLANQIEKLTDSQGYMTKSHEQSASQKIGDAYLDENQFIDVQSLVIVEKIKDYLTETDRLLDDEQKNFKLAMSYLINHFWSMIAHQYNDDNLVTMKNLRDSLLRKIDKVDQVLKSSREESCCNRSMSAIGQVSHSSINSSIHVIDYSSEIESFNQDALLIKDKLEKQSEIIKSLLCRIQEKEAVEQQQQQQQQQETEKKSEEKKQREEEEDDDEDAENYISPGSSPSSHMFSYFQKKFASYEHKKETPTEEADVPTLTTTEEKESDERSKQEEPTGSPTNNTSSDDSLPSNTSDHSDDSSFYYYYNVNGFIAIDKTLALNEHLANQVQSVPSTPNTSSNEDQSEEATSRREETASLSTLRPNEEEVAREERANTPSGGEACYQCPICDVSVDTKLVSFRQFELHVGECNNSGKVCIFCLEKFESNDQDAYEAHINSHMI